MNYLKINKEFLKHYRNDLYEQVKSYEKHSRYAKNIEWDEKYCEIVVKQGKKSVFLHSIYNTEREVTQLIKDKSRQVEQICLFGIPAKKQLSECNKYFKRLKRIFIVVPSIGIFYKWIQYNSLVDLLIEVEEFIKPEEMVFIVEDDFLKVEKLMSDIVAVGQHEKIVNIAFIAYHTLFPEFFLNLCKIIRIALVDKGIMSVTRKLWRNAWLINNWTILSQDAVNIKKVAKLFEENVCVVVAAGASLEKNMHLLKKVYDKAIIIAAGSAGQILFKNGIKPHFNMGVDASDLCNKVFAPLRDSTVPLLCSHSLYSPVVSEYRGNVFTLVIGAMDKVALEGLKFSGEDFLISSGGLSVVNIAHAIAVQMGCKKIVMMGQDCCYTAQKLHAAGSWTEGTRYQNKYSEGETEILMQDIYGATVATSEVLLGLNRAISGFIKNNPQCKFINCTEGGLDIAGAVNRDFGDVIKRDMKNNINISGEINSIAVKYNTNERSLIKGKLKIFADKYKNEMRELENVLQKQKELVRSVTLVKDVDGAYEVLNNAMVLFEDLSLHDIYIKTMQENFIFDINEVLMLDTGKYSYELLEGLKTVNKRLLEHVQAAIVLAEEFLQEREPLNRVIYVR